MSVPLLGHVRSSNFRRGPASDEREDDEMRDYTGSRAFIPCHVSNKVVLEDTSLGLE
jgi:hypothetical protein